MNIMKNIFFILFAIICSSNIYAGPNIKTLGEGCFGNSPEGQYIDVVFDYNTHNHYTISQNDTLEIWLAHPNFGLVGPFFPASYTLNPDMSYTYRYYIMNSGITLYQQPYTVFIVLRPYLTGQAFEEYSTAYQVNPCGKFPPELKPCDASFNISIDLSNPYKYYFISNMYDYVSLAGIPPFLSSNPSSINLYTIWSVDDGSVTQTFVTPYIEFEFPGPGTYEVCLNVYIYNSETLESFDCNTCYYICVPENEIKHTDP